MTSASDPAAANGPGAFDRPIGLWLLLCCAMVFGIVIIGGITRLTHSGLSMVEWKPLIGVLPPLSEAEWLRVFGLYQLSPEYQIINKGMSLAEFQGIFWWEWFHRTYAHLIGLVFAGPFVWFWARGRIRRGLMPRLVGLFLLGGLQGVVGWLMVASGLVDRPAVSHYRLAAHLGTAVLIYTLMLWQALDLLSPQVSSGSAAVAARMRGHLTLALGLTVVTLVWGALVAGLHAGMIYNTFPLMNGALLPSEAWFYQPAWINVFENPATVQFCHRWLAITTGAVTLGYGWRLLGAGGRERPESARRIARWLTLMVLTQIGLGISTLLAVVPVGLAAAHQAGAFALLALLVWALHDWRARPAV
jgi:cytochrome c oxidase assembly protein subunit 15